MSVVLIVDDDRISRMLMMKMLESESVSCLSAVSGEEALEIFKTESVSVLLTDLRMPGISGIELYRQISQERPSVRGILCSSFIDYEVITDLMDLGFDDCLMKPMQKENIISSVRNSLQIQEHWHTRIAEIRKAQRKDSHNG